MCMCHSQRFHCIVKQSCINSQERKTNLYNLWWWDKILTDSHEIRLPLTYISLLLLYSVCVKTESVMFCGLKMQLMVLKYSHYLSIMKHCKIHNKNNKWQRKTIKHPWTRKLAKQAFWKTFQTKFQLWHDAVFLITAAVHSFISSNGNNKLISNSWWFFPYGTSYSQNYKWPIVAQCKLT